MRQSRYRKVIDPSEELEKKNIEYVNGYRPCNPCMIPIGELGKKVAVLWETPETPRLRLTSRLMSAEVRNISFTLSNHQFSL